MDLPTRLDLYSIGRAYVISRARKIDPAQVDTRGSDVNLFVGSGSVVGDSIVRQLGYRVGALFLDSSDGEDLDRYGYDRYTLLRKGASPARTTVTIRRPAATAGAGSVPVGTTVRTDTAIEYVTTTVAAFSASALSARCNVRAVQAGKATQVGQNAIKRFSRPELLFDATLVPSNEDQPSAGGEDQESDDLFRARIRDFWRTARRGVVGAIEFGALSVPGVVSAMAVEALSSGGLPARVVNLYISDSSGVASDALAQEVSVALLDYRSCGIAVLLFTSLPQLVDIVLRLRFTADVNTQILSDQVRAAVFEFVNSLPVNGPLFVGELYAVLRRFVADGLVLDEDTIVAPVGDLVPEIGQTIRTTLDRIVIQ